MSATIYPETLEQLNRIHRHPRISGKFALEKGLWDGRKVAVRICKSRGHARRWAEFNIAYGVLDLTAGRADQIGVVMDGETHLVHVDRVSGIFDMTRVHHKREQS